MKKIKGQLISVNIGSAGTDLVKKPCDSLLAELDGFVGDRHRSLERECWKGDKQPEGTIRRNERMWSGMSTEEIAKIEQKMDLNEPLKASDLGVNLCFQGIPDFSLLPSGTSLKFPSGATLMVEEYNPPCKEMSQKLASIYTTNAGEPLATSAFSRHAKHCRGLVGIIEVAGVITAGDEVTVTLPKLPKWIKRAKKTGDI